MNFQFKFYSEDSCDDLSKNQGYQNCLKSANEAQMRCIGNCKSVGGYISCTQSCMNDFKKELEQCPCLTGWFKNRY